MHLGFLVGATLSCHLINMERSTHPASVVLLVSTESVEESGLGPVITLHRLPLMSCRRSCLFQRCSNLKSHSSLMEAR
ncbi:hypothetical protein K466DRAFT_360769 [Polyporus arcularius HHB13444]|uniref:Uncharacterized protein n=1 Tax=Polyporus arcularius HHB13444 TaxID=1314778 RepID=A0A5C3PSS0_9APHY|nr:hypothetical protein K466DRAFT_360769 [Polyporus arcularius HHB13444]